MKYINAIAADVETEFDGYDNDTLNAEVKVLIERRRFADNYTEGNKGIYCYR